MFYYKPKHSILFQAISLVVIYSFLLSDVAWVQPLVFNSSQQATLAPESRLNPFYDTHKIEFVNRSVSTMAAMNLRHLILDEKARDGEICAAINSFNSSFETSGIKFKIDNSIETRSLINGTKYRSATFRFESEKKVFDVIFLDDHIKLSNDELAELGVIKIDAERRPIIDERHLLNCPGLENVWFVAHKEGPRKSANEDAAEVGSFAFSKLIKSIKLSLERYSNVHRGAGQHSQIATELYDRAGEIALKYFGLNSDEYVVIFNSPRRLKLVIDRLKTSDSHHILWSGDIGLPLGLGALAVKRNALPEGVPAEVGGGTVTAVPNDQTTEWADAPDRFVAGTPNIVGVIAFGEAINIVKAVGDKDVFKKGAKNASKFMASPGLPENLEGAALLLRLREMLIGHGALVPAETGDVPYVNLDHGASTPTFTPIVYAALKTLGQEGAGANKIVADCRTACVEFFHAPGGAEIIFTSNTTEGINIVAESSVCMSGPRQMKLIPWLSPPHLSIIPTCFRGNIQTESPEIR